MQLTVILSQRSVSLACHENVWGRGGTFKRIFNLGAR
jgi:hypothetical protein